MKKLVITYTRAVLFLPYFAPHDGADLVYDLS